MYLLSLLLLPLPALATPLSQDVNAFKSWLVTCLTVLLIGALIFLLTKKRSLSMLRGGEKMRIQSLLSLGVKEKLVLVQVEDRRLLLGITPQQITLLGDLTKEEGAQATFVQLFEANDTAARAGNGTSAAASQGEAGLPPSA